MIHAKKYLQNYNRELQEGMWTSKNKSAIISILNNINAIHIVYSLLQKQANYQDTKNKSFTRYANTK
jgi:hypothetical protein